MTRPCAIPLQSEDQFQDAVLEYAHVRHWLTYHTHDSRRSTSGFPDLAMVRGDVLWFMELKRQDKNPTPEQVVWISALNAVTRLNAAVCRPSDMDEIVRVLR